jgi:polyhydroxybutyrate depolymerase
MPIACIMHKGSTLGVSLFCVALWGCSGSSGEGASSAGGSPSNGGSSAGGAVSGGAATMGGSTTIGGASSHAGAPTTGGVNGTGGAHPAGGSVATGGVALATGGVPTTGGAKATGGALATGGIPTATGGSKTTGGMTSLGGMVNSGGTAQKTSGCGVEPPATVATSIALNGVTRAFILDVPTGYDKNRAYPVVFSWHGMGVSAASFHNYVNISAQVGADGFVVTPDTEAGGTSGSWDSTKDPQLFDAIVKMLEENYCIDPHRIFAAGHSMGGFFTNVLGCARGNVLRGIAPLSGGPPSGTCTGKLGVWITQGKSDTAVTVTTGQAVRDFWVKNSGCDGTSSTPVDPSPCVEYAGCSAGFPVRYCEYDGDHQPPSFAASGLWGFFKGLN